MPKKDLAPDATVGGYAHNADTRLVMNARLVSPLPLPERLRTAALRGSALWCGGEMAVAGKARKNAFPESGYWAFLLRG